MKGKSRIVFIWCLILILVLVLSYNKYQNDRIFGDGHSSSSLSSGSNGHYKMVDVADASVVKINLSLRTKTNDSINTKSVSTRLYQKCSHHSCFDVSKCEVIARKHIQVYVYPIANYVDSSNGVPLVNEMNPEMKQVVKTITSSPYFTSVPSEACLFVIPFSLASVSTTGLTHLYGLKLKDEKLRLFNRIMESNSFWTSKNPSKSGSNHLLIDFKDFFRNNNDVQMNNSAMIASPTLSSWTFRHGFDVSIPFYDPVQESFRTMNISGTERNKKWTLFIPSIDTFTRTQQQVLTQLEDENQHLIKSASSKFEDHKDWPPDKKLILETASSKYCLINSNHQLTLSLMANCVPVVLIGDQELIFPFEEKVNYNLLLIKIRKERLSEVLTVLNSIPRHEYLSLKNYGNYVYKKYMSSISRIVLTTLEIINDRLIPFSIEDNEEEINFLTCNQRSSGNDVISDDEAFRIRKKKMKIRRKDVFS